MIRVNTMSGMQKRAAAIRAARKHINESEMVQEDMYISNNDVDAVADLESDFDALYGRFLNKYSYMFKGEPIAILDDIDLVFDDEYEPAPEFIDLIKAGTKVEYAGGPNLISYDFSCYTEESVRKLYNLLKNQIFTNYPEECDEMLNDYWPDFYAKCQNLNICESASVNENRDIYPEADPEAQHIFCQELLRSGMTADEIFDEFGIDCRHLDADDDNDVAELPAEEVINTTSVEAVPVPESVSSRFAKYRKLYEGLDEGDEEEEDDIFAGLDDEDTPVNDTDAPAEDDPETVEDKSDTEELDAEDEEIPMTAVIITVKKGDEDKCKEEMIDANIPEDSIEIMDADDDAENVDIRVDVDAIEQLQSYLEGKGIDLEEKLGGEIVGDDDDDAEEDESADEDKKDEEKDPKDENPEDEDVEDFDFDAKFGDLFADDDE